MWWWFYQISPDRRFGEHDIDSFTRCTVVDLHDDEFDSVEFDVIQRGIHIGIPEFNDAQSSCRSHLCNFLEYDD